MSVSASVTLSLAQGVSPLAVFDRLLEAGWRLEGMVCFDVEDADFASDAATRPALRAELEQALAAGHTASVALFGPAEWGAHLIVSSAPEACLSLTLNQPRLRDRVVDFSRVVDTVLAGPVADIVVAIECWQDFG